MAEETYKVLVFLKRRAGTSLEEFRDYYENRHVPLCMKYMAGAHRYVRRYVQTQLDEATGAPIELDFDVVTELWYKDRATFDNVLAYAGRGIVPEEIIADEERVFDRSKIRYASVIESETDLSALSGN